MVGGAGGQARAEEEVARAEVAEPAAGGGAALADLGDAEREQEHARHEEADRAEQVDEVPHGTPLHDHMAVADMASTTPPEANMMPTMR